MTAPSVRLGRTPVYAFKRVRDARCVTDNKTELRIS
jgi:hypothetical protein